MTHIPRQYVLKFLNVALSSMGLALWSATIVCAADTGQEHGTRAVAATSGTVLSTSPEQLPAPAALRQRHPRYQLCKGDTFDVAFPFTPEFNQTATVQPDGYVTLSGIGDLYIAGKTVPELREFLQEAYKKILHDPVINIVLKDFEKPYFIVGGEITHPGKFDMRDDTTATQAVAIAGGFTENSKHSEVLLFRRVSSDWVEVKKLNVKKMFNSEDLAEDLHLQTGDMLYIPKSRIGKIRKYIPYPNLGMYLDPSKF